MEKKIFYTLLISLSFNLITLSQTTDGEIMGRVWNSDSSETVVGANVTLEVNGELKGIPTDINGKFRLSSIPTGTYTVSVSFAGEKKILHGVAVLPNEITRIGEVVLSNNILTGIEIVWKPKMLKEDELSKIDISYQEIQNSAVRSSPMKLVASAAGTQLTADGNGVIIRGSRPQSTIYYIDGIKQTSLAAIPSAATGSISVYTGGLPAKYGDCTGGVVVMETVSYFDLYNRWKSQQLK